MNARPLLTVLVSTRLLPLAPRAEDVPDPLARFGWFRDLAGACWAGEYPDGKTSDRQCYETQWGRFLRGTIALSS